jgi:hypothetical protein
MTVDNLKDMNQRALESINAKLRHISLKTFNTPKAYQVKLISSTLHPTRNIGMVSQENSYYIPGKIINIKYIERFTNTTEDKLHFTHPKEVDTIMDSFDWKKLIGKFTPFGIRTLNNANIVKTEQIWKMYLSNFKERPKSISKIDISNKRIIDLITRYTLFYNIAIGGLTDGFGANDKDTWKHIQRLEAFGQENENLMVDVAKEYIRVQNKIFETQGQKDLMEEIGTYLPEDKDDVTFHITHADHLRMNAQNSTINTRRVPVLSDYRDQLDLADNFLIELEDLINGLLIHWDGNHTDLIQKNDKNVSAEDLVEIIAEGTLERLKSHKEQGSRSMYQAYYRWFRDNPKDKVLHNMHDKYKLICMDGFCAPALP